MPAPITSLDAFGTLVREARKARKLSQDALARTVRIAQSDLSAIEVGSERARLSVALVVSLAAALGLDRDDLLCAAGDRVENASPSAA